MVPPYLEEKGEARKEREKEEGGCGGGNGGEARWAPASRFRLLVAS